MDNDNILLEQERKMALLKSHAPEYFDATTKDLGDLTIPKLPDANWWVAAHTIPDPRNPSLLIVAKGVVIPDWVLAHYPPTKFADQGE